MGSRTVSPGGALLRTSRMFSLPKPLPKPQSTNSSIGEHKSATMTKHSPQLQTITSSLSSREKGDWGLKRAMPLKTTMATSTPLIRVRKVDSLENITDFSSASDQSLSLEKFQELQIAISVPASKERRASSLRGQSWFKSVFEDDMDLTDFEEGSGDSRRWKFEGPWLARMTEGEFMQYLSKKVRPRREGFKALLKQRLSEQITSERNSRATEEGTSTSPPVKPAEITDAEFTDYLRSLRNDRVTLYSLVSKFLDLAPLGLPQGLIQSVWFSRGKAPESPYGRAGPPPSHPSAGISYLRTYATMENHPVYGPQAKKTSTLARVIYPRSGAAPPKLGVGGFVANAPSGDNEFNTRFNRTQRPGGSALSGIHHLDIKTLGGAKAYVEAIAAVIDPSGKVVIQLAETSPESQVIEKEKTGDARLYDSNGIYQAPPTQQVSDRGLFNGEGRLEQLSDAFLSHKSSESTNEERHLVGSRDSYGLGQVPRVRR